jgi:methylated-DNA-[protein]-cysteine S-methyltransferase
MIYCYFESPFGTLLLAGHELLESLHFPVGKTRIEPGKNWQYSKEKFKDALYQLEAYFKGELKTFDLKLNLCGTSFQKKVWQELINIPYGETISYGELAKRIGNPRACRAVGLANGKNPVSIIVPCHRVIGKDGSLTGFGGGIGVKKRLLELERKYKKSFFNEYSIDLLPK